MSASLSLSFFVSLPLFSPRHVMSRLSHTNFPTYWNDRDIRTTTAKSRPPASGAFQDDFALGSIYIPRPRNGFRRRSEPSGHCHDNPSYALYLTVVNDILLNSLMMLITLKLLLMWMRLMLKMCVAPSFYIHTLARICNQCRSSSVCNEFCMYSSIKITLLVL